MYDVNVDGVAQYGLHPDWIEDLTEVAGSDGEAIEDDMSVRQVMRAVGQPWQRLGRELTYCAASGDRKALMTVTLTRGARVDDVRRS